MYLINFGREYSIIVDSLVQAITFAVDAFKNEWEVDVINISTGEIMVSLRDNKMPYFSNAIKEVFNQKGSVTMIKKEAITLIAQRKPAYVAVMKELEELRSFFYDDVELVSAETGEVFSMEEIDRVLAILGGIVNDQTWRPQFVNSEKE